MYDYNDRDSFRVINQTGVKQACLPMDHHYNACWDGFMDSKGRVYVPAASEITVGEYASLYGYTYHDNSLTQLFYGKDVFLAPERSVTSSKFHFSIGEMPDGRIIACSHTTDKAPAHPSWLYEQYYYHIWEGYPGSSIIVYDPETKQVENIGVPVPRETIYGAVFNPHDNGYYMLGFSSGCLYRYSFVTKRVTNFGKVTENKTFRLHVGPDGDVYGASKSGWMFKLDIQTDRVTDLGRQITASPERSGYLLSTGSRSMSCGLNIPGTSKFLFTVFAHLDVLFEYDTASNTLRDLGSLHSADYYCKGFSSTENVYGMQLDADGVLWYPMTCYPDVSKEGNGDFSYRPGPSLMRWDLFRGGKPECLGIIGTPGRSGATATAFMLDKDRELMYLFDTNHATDGISILGIDMKQFKPHMYDKGPVCTDPYMYPDAPRYKQQRAQSKKMFDIIDLNTPYFAPVGIKPILLWRSCPPEDSGVVGLAWQDEITVVGTCGGTGGAPMYCFTIATDGRLLSFAPLERTGSFPPVSAEIGGACADLPYYSGRQYMATPSASIEWNHGRRLVGTRDGMLALINEDSDTYALGPAAPYGPIRGLTADAARSVAYGIAGDPDGLGTIFRYDDIRGVRQLGRINFEELGGFPPACSNHYSCIALNQDGTMLAIGSSDRLGVVYIVTL